MGRWRPGPGDYLTLPTLLAAVLVAVREWQNERQLAVAAIVSAVLALGGVYLVGGLVLIPVVSLLGHLGRLTPDDTDEGMMKRRALVQGSRNVLSLVPALIAAYLIYRSFS